MAFAPILVRLVGPKGLSETITCAYYVVDGETGEHVFYAEGDEELMRVPEADWDMAVAMKEGE